MRSNFGDVPVLLVFVFLWNVHMGSFPEHTVRTFPFISPHLHVGSTFLLFFEWVLAYPNDFLMIKILCYEGISTPL